MSGRLFELLATVSSDNPDAVEPVLTRLIGNHGTVARIGVSSATRSGVGEFRVQAQMEGESAKELNRSLLSALRKVEKKTRLRAAWSSKGEVEEFFDYVQKRKPPQAPAP